MLPKAGNSTAYEQQQLINEFIQAFNPSAIRGILGDREFANAALLRWLDEKHLPFYSRIKEGSVVGLKGRKWIKAKTLFDHLRLREHGVFNRRVKLWGQPVYMAGSRSERGELMLVATNQAPQNAIAIYLRRWEIENLFQGLKSRGFRLEETRLTQPDRLAKLLALLAVGFVWAHKVGEWCALQKPILTKRFRECQTPHYTFFRYGLDFLRQVVFRRQYSTKLFKKCLQLIAIPTNKKFISKNCRVERLQ